MKDTTSDWALVSRAHFRGAYLFGLLAFVLFSHMFSSLMSSFLFLQGHWQFTNFLFCLEFKKINTKELNHGNVGKMKDYGHMLPFFFKCNATLHRMKIKCATFRTLGLNSVVLLCLTFVLCYCWFHGLSEACMFYVDYIFFLYIKKKT